MRRAVLLGIAALAAAFVAAAATVSSPYRPSASSATAARLAAPGQEALDFDAAGLSVLRAAGQGPVRVEGFPIAPGVLGTLLLKRFEVTTPDARVTVHRAEGEQSFPFPSTAHFSGKVQGDPDSAVYVGAQEHRLVAYVRSSAGSSYVGPDESDADFVVRAADSPLNDDRLGQAFSCGTEELPAALTGMSEPSYPSPLAPLAGLSQAAVRVETDYELYAKFGDVSALANYVAALYGAINVVYERDLTLHLAVAEVHAWTAGAGADPYVSSSTRTQLDEVGDWWHANRPMGTYPRAMVHFLSGKAVSGGIAWLSVLCSGDFSSGGGHWGGAYGVTQVYGSYPTLDIWDQFATAHEMGHNAGSRHTHCYAPPIDHCYNAESGCYSGPVENPGAGNGTIMSYCHLLGWQYVSMKFHQRCIDEQMMPEINSASCLTQASTFIDVPPSHPFFQYVETLAANGVTSGCGGNYYCPDASVTRAQMAVFLLKSKFGASHVPPPATGTVFADVPANAFAAAWIEELASLGATGGCGGGNYCPGGTVTRRQMSVFLLKTKYGSGHVPPAATGVFADVPVSDPFAAWIEELYASAITGGCMTNPLRYCPNSPNTRGQMAVFLVKTFNLQ
ncbi:MAG: M12 family metallo-peptidase [Thermoanaerobaculia bacterium]